ncbi:MAG: hypothetical protein FXF54_15010 [Kosmotoga sp.]|nr:MAG: hypothetical protein FXF54_15010 [Kosmotoga sp.]
MKKLYLSDLHIGNGTTRDAFSFDKELAELLNSASEDNYDEMIIVGDGLELMSAVNVKLDDIDQYFRIVDGLDERVIDEIEQHHKVVFDAFRNFSRNSRIKYIIGNHDSYLLFNEKLRKRLIEKLGGEGRVEILPYYFDNEMKIFCVHGNQYDIINRYTYDKKNEKILFSFGEYMSHYMKENFDYLLIEKNIPEEVLEDYHNVHPTLDVFHWFNYVRNDRNIPINLFELWTNTFAKMIKSDYAKEWMKVNYPGLRFLSNFFVNKIGGMKLGDFVIRVVMAVRTLKRTDYMYEIAQSLLGALGMNAFKKAVNEELYLCYGDSSPVIVPGELKGCIMGHNHKYCAKIVTVDGEKKFYINTGTWKPVVELIDGKSDKGFEQRIELTYVIIEKEDDNYNIETIHTRKLKGISI